MRDFSKSSESWIFLISVGLIVDAFFQQTGTFAFDRSYIAASVGFRLAQLMTSAQRTSTPPRTLIADDCCGRESTVIKVRPPPQPTLPNDCPLGHPR